MITRRIKLTTVTIKVDTEVELWEAAVLYLCFSSDFTFFPFWDPFFFPFSFLASGWLLRSRWTFILLDVLLPFLLLYSLFPVSEACNFTLSVLLIFHGF